MDLCSLLPPYVVELAGWLSFSLTVSRGSRFISLLSTVGTVDELTDFRDQVGMGGRGGRGLVLEIFDSSCGLHLVLSPAVGS